MYFYKDNDDENNKIHYINNDILLTHFQKINNTKNINNTKELTKTFSDINIKKNNSNSKELTKTFSNINIKKNNINDKFNIIKDKKNKLNYYNSNLKKIVNI